MRTLRLVVFVLFVAVAAAPAIHAATVSDPDSWCGTHTGSGYTAVERHEYLVRRAERDRDRGLLPEKMGPVVRQEGQVAVIDDDGTLVSPPNVFDLHGQSMQFLRRPKGTSAVRAPIGYKELIGDKVAIGDDDSVRIDFPSNFRFPFGDKVYSSVFLNSDGNLTFDVPESSSAARSLDRFLFGPPRIAPFFADLDPSAAAADEGVFVTFIPDRLRITWVGVPEFGENNRNTFQVTLYTTGRVLVAYSDEMDAQVGIVGVNAFSEGQLHLMNYTEELPFRPQRVAIAEEFNDEEVIDDVGIARTFFQHHQDVYEMVAVWLDFRASLLGGNAFAYASVAQNEDRGIGLPRFDFSAQWGSPGRFEHFIQMGWIGRHSADLGEIVNRTYTTQATLSHEIGHRWLTRVGYRENGVVTGRLIGAGGSHWSQHLDAEGSLMEGLDYEDQGNGSFTITDRTTTRFSLLDQYMMGLVPAGAVPPFFYIENASAFDQDGVPDLQALQTTSLGQRVDATVDGVVAAEGARRPAAAAAKKDFRIAFIIVGREGDPVSQESIDLLNTLRDQLPDYWQQVTNGRSTMRSAIFRK